MLMRHKFRISMITVTFNCVNTVEQTIKSVLNQKSSDIEYIIVDGMSTDGTWEVINQYADRIDRIIHEPDTGIYDAMNKGIAASSGEIIGFINGDDWLDDETISTVIDSFDDGIDVLYGRIYVLKKDGSYEISEKESMEDIWYKMIPHPSVFVKRSCFSRWGFFDDRYLIAADYDLILRFYINNAKFLYNNQLTVYFREGGVSTTRTLESALEVREISNKYVRYCDDREKFQELIIRRFVNSIFDYICCDDSYGIRRRIENKFDHQLGDLCVFGAGYWGTRLLERLKINDIKCSRIVDNNESRIGEIIGDTVVYSPQILIHGKWDVIIATSSGFEGIKEQIRKYNNPLIRCYWLPEIDDDLYRLCV